MDLNVNLPPNIENFVSTIKKLESKPRLSSEEKKKVSLCKLKVAIWACRTERMPLSRYSLSEILGSETATVFAHTEQAMLDINWETREDREINKAIRRKYYGDGSDRKKKAGSGDIGLFK